MTDRKRYEATIRLGAVSDTYDGDGVIQSTGVEVRLTEDQILEAMKEFTRNLIKSRQHIQLLNCRGKKHMSWQDKENLSKFQVVR
jgi:hypothetical protein